MSGLCPRCLAPLAPASPVCGYCGLTVAAVDWQSARQSSVHAYDQKLQTRTATDADHHAARLVVNEAIETGLTGRNDAQRSLWAVDHAQTWRDLEVAIAPAIGASSKPLSGTWVVAKPKATVEVAPDKSNRVAVLSGIVTAVVLIALIAGAIYVNRDNKKTNNASSTTTTRPGNASTTTRPGSPPNTTIANAPVTTVPNSPTTSSPSNQKPDPLSPPTTTQPQQQAQSATGAATQSTAAQDRLQKVIEVVNAAVDSFSGDVGEVQPQPYPRLPGFIDCYPTESDPLSIPKYESSANYARATAQFYSSFDSPLNMSDLRQYYAATLDADGFNVTVKDTVARKTVLLNASKSGVNVTIELQAPSTTDQLLETHILITGIDRCTRVQ